MSKQSIYLDFITHIKDSQYKLEGYMGGDELAELDEVKLVVGDVEYGLASTHREQHQEGIDIDRAIDDSTFETVVSLPDHKVNIYFVANGKKMKVRPNRFSGLSRLVFSSKRKGSHVFHSSFGRMLAKPLGSTNKLVDELRIIGGILVNWRLVDVCRRLQLSKKVQSISAPKELVKSPLIIGEAIVKIPLSIGLRLAYHLTKNRYKKPIWLISDRGDAAGDNGEAFFRHVMSKNDKSHDVRFIISKKSPDFERIKSIGPVVSDGSLLHKLLFLHSSMVISSQANVETTNPFLRQLPHFVDLFDFDFVFLQHGIIRHDLSSWLNRFNKNISLFVTSSKMEYDSIFDNKYHYLPENIILTGLPRYDLLENEPKNKLILSPTYRKSLVRLKSNRHGERGYDSEFKKSEYFKFYSRFMNDKRLVEVMRKHNMTGELYIHPVFASQRVDFEGSELFEVMDYPYNYKKAFREGSLMVSDHSSVVFDFVYLKKPVLYAHFDVDTFFDGHSYDKSDFFSDSRDGFGEVCLDYESLVSHAVQLIESGCIMTDKYKRRVDKYFYKTDKNNSERVYQAVLAKEER